MERSQRANRAQHQLQHYRVLIRLEIHKGRGPRIKEIVISTEFTVISRKYSEFSIHVIFPMLSFHKKNLSLPVYYVET